jgi:hypothetical protein
MALFLRTQSPPNYSRSRQYKHFLRLDFLKRCAYCERPEEYMGGEDAFEVEHFRPRRKFPQLDCVYANLYYACGGCNGHKWETWPSESQLAEGMRFADPCEEDPYLHHILETGDGGVQGATPCGAYTTAHIRLNRLDVSKWRRLRAQALADLPLLNNLARSLEQLRSVTLGSELQELEGSLGLIRRYIEDSQLRFGIG